MGGGDVLMHTFHPTWCGQINRQKKCIK